jgi:UDP-N-acetylglucosamine 2-epimerase
MVKIALIIGTRPEVIKVATLANTLRAKLREDFQLWDTGQHYDYNLDQVFYDEMGITLPDVNFNIQSGATSEQIGKIMCHVENNLAIFKPNKVVVVGDTNSTFGAAFMAKRCGYKLAHIESGAREYFIQYLNGKPMFHKTKAMLTMPENLNRILIDNMSDYLFTPTPMSHENLLREKLYGDIVYSGDIQYDVLLKYLPNIKKRTFPHNNYNLLTLHRQENTNYKNVLIRIMDAFIESGEEVIFPIHPRTKKKLEEIGKYKDVQNASNINLVEPMGYFDFINAIIHSKKVFTDSGVVQTEAYFLEKPCVTLRESTGWTDLVMSGNNIVIGSNKKRIIEELKSTETFINKVHNIYGSGHATDIIVSHLLRK